MTRPLRLAFVAFALWVGACSTLDDEERRELASRSVKQEHRSLRLTTSWLVGSWVPDRPYCETDTGINFEANGTYDELEGTGIWSLVGNTLTMTLKSFHQVPDPPAESSTVKVKVLGPNEMEMKWRGARSLFYRCH
jgi:hypothetical protein